MTQLEFNGLGDEAVTITDTTVAVADLKDLYEMEPLELLMPVSTYS